VRGDIAMKRFGWGLMTFAFAALLLAAPAGAQDKLTLGLTGGT